MSRGRLAIAGVWLGALIAFPAASHPDLSEYVQHDVTITAGPTYLDVSVELTYYDRLAHVQAALLDTDGDGRVALAERQAARAPLLADATAHLFAFLDSTELSLVPLHDPEIDATALSGLSDGPAQLTVRLQFFARLPRAVARGARITVRDGLAPALPALARFQVQEKAGVSLAAESDGQVLSRDADADAPLVYRARVDAVRAAAPEGTTNAKPEKEGASP